MLFCQKQSAARFMPYNKITQSSWTNFPILLSSDTLRCYHFSIHKMLQRMRITHSPQWYHGIDPFVKAIPKTPYQLTSTTGTSTLDSLQSLKAMLAYQDTCTPPMAAQIWSRDLYQKSKIGGCLGLLEFRYVTSQYNCHHNSTSRISWYLQKKLEISVSWILNWKNYILWK